MATIGFKTSGLSEQAKRALERAPNKSEYIRRALELYESRSEYEEILNRLGELKEFITNMAVQKVETHDVGSTDKQEDNSKKTKLEEELLAGLSLF